MSDSKITKRRRKVIRSCTFCRKRKLKCDHGKPMCKQCLERKLPNCIYTDDFNFQLTTDELFSDSPNVELIRRIKELKARLEEKTGDSKAILDTPPSSITSSSSGSISNSTTLSSPPLQNNPLWEYRIVVKAGDQNIIFGPTSWRTTVVSQGERFQAEYRKLWDMIIPERNKWMTENCLDCGLSPSEAMLSTNENDTLINAVCKELPPLTEIKECVSEFFADRYHDIFKVLDQEKIVRDLEQSFVPSKKNAELVCNLIAPNDDGNYYKVALILLIICIVKFKAVAPPIFEKFFLSLNALKTASRLNFIERSQFLLLRFFNKVYCSYVCCEAPQLAGLVAELSECSLNLGLGNVDWSYEGQEQTVGPLYTLRNVWFWTLYADVMVSFELGKPLLISDDHFDPKILLEYEQESWNPNDLLRRRRTILLNFLKVSRCCMSELNSRSKSGDVEWSKNQLLSFITDNLLPIKYYTCRDFFPTIDLFDVIVLAPTLGMLLNFHNIQRISLKMKTLAVKNGLTKFGLLSLSLCVNTILGVFDMDQHSDDGRNALNFALLLVNPLLMRVLSEMYAAFFYKLSLFEKGGTIFLDKGISSITLDNFETPTTDFYSFSSAITMFKTIIDQLFDKSRAKLQKAFAKSYSITTTLALERVSRTLFEKGRESRTMTENSCIFESEGTISQETLNQMTDIFWSTYEQQSQDLWSMKPQDFYSDRNFSFDLDLDLK